MTVDGVTATSPLLVTEGSHTICVTATSASATAASATECRTVPLRWPRFEGRAIMYDAHGAVTPPGLTLTLDDGAVFAINSADGSFSIPSAKAQFSDAKLVFSGASAVMTSLVRTRSVEAINVVMLPTQLTIPACSVYGGQSKRITAQDSAEVMTVLSMLTSYVCQGFHLAPVVDARRDGIVIIKDPEFAALGAHSMALPSTRDDYVRAEVVLRRITADSGAVRDSVRRTMMHEFFHVLGLGHTCAWPTVMTTGTVCATGTYAFVPSAPDVAHFFAMRYARQGERALSTLYSLGPAYMGRLVGSGGVEFPLASYFAQP